MNATLKLFFAIFSKIPVLDLRGLWFERQIWPTNIFLHCEFQLFMFSSLKVSFGRGAFWEFLTPENHQI